MRALRGVVLASPGGEHNGIGGMGSATRLIAAGLRLSHPDLDVQVLDPRGTGAAWLSVWFLFRAIVDLVGIRSRSSGWLLHAQVSERLSFFRKGVLVLLARRLGMPVVLHHHGAELVEFYKAASRPARLWIRLIVANAHVNIVLGEIWRTFLVQELRAKPSQVVVLPNAVEDLRQQVHERSKRLASRPAGRELRLLLLANLSPRKGVSEFLASIAGMRARGINAVAVLAGGGEIARYSAEAGALGMGEVCEFRGWVARDAVPDLLAWSDALVLPSFNEGLPIAILEALSAEVPIVATPVGSIPEVLVHEEAALLVPPGDARALEEALSRLWTDPQLGRRLARNGRLLFERQFSIRPYLESLLAVYEAAGRRADDR